MHPLPLGFFGTGLLLAAALGLLFAGLALALSGRGQRRWVWPAWAGVLLTLATGAALAAAHTFQPGGPSLGRWLAALTLALAPSSLGATAVPYLLSRRARRVGGGAQVAWATGAFLLLVPLGLAAAALVPTVELTSAGQ